jgi:hypothetical protein
MSDWTQPICDSDWINREGARRPIRLVPAVRVEEHCCDCGEPTMSGIYIRVDPAIVRYPKAGK